MKRWPLESRFGAGIGAPVLKMTASARAFQRCMAHTYVLMAYIVMALYNNGAEPGKFEEENVSDVKRLALRPCLVLAL